MEECRAWTCFLRGHSPRQTPAPVCAPAFPPLSQGEGILVVQAPRSRQQKAGHLDLASPRAGTLAFLNVCFLVGKEGGPTPIS